MTEPLDCDCDRTIMGLQDEIDELMDLLEQRDAQISAATVKEDTSDNTVHDLL